MRCTTNDRDFVTGRPTDGAPPGARVVAEQTPLRLDLFLASANPPTAHLSRSRLKRLVLDGHVQLGGAVTRDPAALVHAGQAVAVVVPPAADPVPRGETMPLDILFEDAHLLVLDKPAGLVVHPGAGHAGGTLVNALIAHCGASLSGIGGVKRPGIVHRLDKDTSGLLVVAKTDAAHAGLSALFADHGRTMPLTRIYRGLVWGVPERDKGAIDAPLGRHAVDRERMAVVAAARGRHAVTHWRRLRRFGAPAAPVASLIECRLETGRTHQIRVHLAHIGHPLLGDPTYHRGMGSKAARLGGQAQAALASLRRQALHAAALGFPHPVTGATLAFESPLPGDLARLLAALEAES